MTKTTRKKKHTKKAYPVIVRTYSAGVHFGDLVWRRGKELELTNARRIWQWKGANTLNEIALRGVAAGSRVAEPVQSIVLTEAIEIITCAPAGAEAMRSAAWAK